MTSLKIPISARINLTGNCILTLEIVCSKKYSLLCISFLGLGFRVHGLGFSLTGNCILALEIVLGKSQNIKSERRYKQDVHIIRVL